MTDNEWDKFLKIHTSGRDDTKADNYHYPYEPTSYLVLERLASSGIISKGNTLLDYGCGKGRVSLFFAYQSKCQSVGVEYDERLYKKALDNKESGISGGRVSFVYADATEYDVPAEVDRVFFFNPFSVTLLKRVLKRILKSYYDNPRQIYLMFYYPSAEYISCLMQQGELIFYDEVDCSDLFIGDTERERIMIFELT